MASPHGIIEVEVRPGEKLQDACERLGINNGPVERFCITCKHHDTAPSPPSDGLHSQHDLVCKKFTVKSLIDGSYSRWCKDVRFDSACGSAGLAWENDRACNRCKWYKNHFMGPECIHPTFLHTYPDEWASGMTFGHAIGAWDASEGGTRIYKLNVPCGETSPLWEEAHHDL